MIIALRSGLTITIYKHAITLRGVDNRGNPIVLWLEHSELAIINRCVEDSLKEKDDAK